MYAASPKSLPMSLLEVAPTGRNAEQSGVQVQGGYMLGSSLPERRAWSAARVLHSVANRFG